MARPQNRRTQSTRPRGNGRKPRSNSKVFIILGAVGVIAVIGVLAWVLWPTEHTGRTALDKYIELSRTENILDDGASVYVDLSDGMLSAYESDQSKKNLQAIINKFAASDGIQFFGLSDGKIEQLNKTHTELYNYMLSENSYSKQQAPIEKALQQIISKNQPALLMTDFEEYNNGRIQTAAYAKKYFIDWLAKGYNINFYKWDFTEGSQSKHMFFAVFDDNANRLNSLVATALANVDPNIETYVLGSHDFAYPTSTSYPSLKQGGNYHNASGKDIVTAVMENGGSEDYISYAKPYATATGIPGQFAPLDQLLGTYAEYYPIGVNWHDAVNNSKKMQEQGIKDEDVFTHLFSNLYIDFEAQTGFIIDNIEVRVFDVEQLVNAAYNEESIDESIQSPEVNEIFTAGMTNADGLPQGWKHIFIDFDEKFDGNFPKATPATDLLRANIVISKATPNLDKADSFFGWQNNPSIANSVKETLTAASSNPTGRVLFTYYIKCISE